MEEVIQMKFMIIILVVMAKIFISMWVPAFLLL